MTYNLVIQAEAVSDLQDAFEWYEDQKIDLGYEFLEEVENCYIQITSHPERYSYFNSFYRRIKTRRFPYLIIFEVVGNDIIVNSVLHVKRDRH